MKNKLIKFLLLSGLFIFTSCNNSETSSINSEDILTSSEDTISENISSNDNSSLDDKNSFEENSLSEEISSLLNDSSQDDGTSISNNFYKVTWTNYDDTVLEIDENVLEGTMPSYDGILPTKDGNEEVIYVFDSWSPTLSEVVDDITYKATFKEIEVSNNEKEGVIPTISEDKKTIKYGFYPQSYVDDESLINSLNESATLTNNGWYYYEGEYYFKEIANVFSGDTYKFENGTTITNNAEIWFKCDAIEWNVLNQVDGTYLLVAKKLLDASCFNSSYENEVDEDKTIYANNYEYSDIRNFLNNDFYSSAFSLNNSFIKETLYSNNVSTTNDLNNKYVCNDTLDNVTLLSYQDYLNLDYGFENNNDVSKSRICYTTDFARIKGIYCNKDNSYSSGYWTRSPSSEFNYSAWNVNSGGYLSEYMVNSATHAIRPCITIYSI